MSNENAALADDESLGTDLGQDQEEDKSKASPDSATGKENEGVKTEDEDNFQGRINKVTADKYTEKRRGDRLAQELATLKAKKAETPATAPKLEDFDHDEDLFREATINFQVDQRLSARTAETEKESSNITAQDAQVAFEGRIKTFAKDDFDTVSAAIPELPPGVAGELVNSELGPELIYHLGTHLDVADKLANMTPQAAMMELGRISAGLNAKTERKSSAAPDPIEPLAPGAKLANVERGPKGATYE